ncbi:MAG: hypothetical protein NXI12_09725 [Alphaproteobacteria bacterium]|nr:hypothetical protein [Alphaproteobacteria bacterium]
MKRRLAQISLALVAIATLSACIIISSESAPEFAPAEPAAASADAQR